MQWILNSKSTKVMTRSYKVWDIGLIFEFPLWLGDVIANKFIDFQVREGINKRRYVISAKIHMWYFSRDKMLSVSECTRTDASTLHV